MSFRREKNQTKPNSALVSSVCVFKLGVLTVRKFKFTFPLSLSPSPNWEFWILKIQTNEKKWNPKPNHQRSNGPCKTSRSENPSEKGNSAESISPEKPRWTEKYQCLFVFCFWFHFLSKTLNLNPSLSHFGLAEQIHSGVEGDIQRANRKVQNSAPAQERNGDSNRSSPPKYIATLRLVPRLRTHFLDSRIRSWWRAL